MVNGGLDAIGEAVPKLNSNPIFSGIKAGGNILGSVMSGVKGLFGKEDLEDMEMNDLTKLIEQLDELDKKTEEELLMLEEHEWEF